MYLVHDIITFVDLHKYFNLSNFKEQVTSVFWRNMSKDHCYERLSKFFLHLRQMEIFSLLAANCQLPKDFHLAV